MRGKFWYMGPWVVRLPYFRNDDFKISVANVLTESTMCNYADDTTFYACHMDLENLARRLKHDLRLELKLKLT